MMSVSETLEDGRISIGLSVLIALVLAIFILRSLMFSDNYALKLEKAPAQLKPSESIVMEVVSLPSPPAAPDIQFSATPRTPEKPKKANPSLDPLAGRKPDPSITVDESRPDVILEGRALLKILETGKGPNVEIGWPAGGRAQQALYQAFTACLGLRSGYLDEKGRVFLKGGAAGYPAKINADDTSLFLRQIVGDISATERRLLNDIKQYHGLHKAQPVRLFNRAVDAALLGGVFRVLPNGVLNNPHIQATYQLNQGAVIIHQIKVNEQPVRGLLKLDLGLLGRC